MHVRLPGVACFEPTQERATCKTSFARLHDQYGHFTIRLARAAVMSSDSSHGLYRLAETKALRYSSVVENLHRSPAPVKARPALLAGP